MDYKLVYLTPTLASPAGMERVLHNKVCWLVRNHHHNIIIVTTDQGQSPLYFDFPKEVRIIDLGINYSASFSLNPIARTIALYKKRRLHKRKLTALLLKERPDITVALYPSEISVLSRIKDGSKKVLEFHSNRFFRMNQGYQGIHAWVARYRTWADKRFVSRFDRCVVLTHEAMEQWGNMSNLEAIPNAITHVPSVSAVNDSHRVIAVGRLIYEKGFDRLLKAWALLPDDVRRDWRLDIFGGGEQEASLNALIKELGIDHSAKICPPTRMIFEEYAKSSFLVTTSRSEGFGMVILEAMSCGIPVISYDFQCGPREIIQDGINGFLVQKGNIEALSEKILFLIQNPDLRNRLASNAKEVRTTFSEDRIMHMWEHLFDTLLSS